MKKDRKIYNAKYWEENKDRISRQRKAYYKENREEILARNKEWLENNREKWNAYMRERRKKSKAIDETKNI